MLSRRTLLAGIAAAPTIWSGTRARAAGYPERPIHLIVPFAAGGNADIVGRIAGDQIGKNLNATVVVENRGGAGGAIGADYVAKASPDGYVLLVGSNGPLTVNPFVQAQLGYDPLKDFAPVGLTSYVPHALVVSNKVDAKTFSDVLALSKKSPVTVATSGLGSATYMTFERLKAATGGNFTHVPYRGGGALMPDVIGGNVNSAMTELSTALSLHKGGQARIVAIAAARRSQLANDIPTFDESGVKGFTAQSFIGVLAPAKTPDEVIAKLQSAIEKGFGAGSPAVERLTSIGAEVATPEQQTAKGFAAFIRADYEAMRDAAKIAGITPT
jgi:tripartite-type tricarboxylate transporter receptor subunit TctC